MATSTVVKSIVVKATSANDLQIKEHAVSELGPLDLMHSFFPLNIAFVYDYTVDVAVLEHALARVLDRYPEMSGRSVLSLYVITSSSSKFFLFTVDSA